MTQADFQYDNLSVCQSVCKELRGKHVQQRWMVCVFVSVSCVCDCSVIALRRTTWHKATVTCGCVRVCVCLKAYKGTVTKSATEFGIILQTQLRPQSSSPASDTDTLTAAVNLLNKHTSLVYSTSTENRCSCCL